MPHLSFFKVKCATFVVNPFFKTLMFTLQWVCIACFVSQGEKKFGQRMVTKENLPYKKSEKEKRCVFLFVCVYVCVKCL